MSEAAHTRRVSSSNFLATGSICAVLKPAGCVVLIAAFAASSYSADVSVHSGRGANSAIVVGFVGGFVHRNDQRHSEVQLAEKLSSEYQGRAHVAIFENRHRNEALASVLNWLDNDRDGGLSASEKQQARIILYGHSWGASAVLALARELAAKQIPVVLTIQVDTIGKPGLDDRTVPSNVERAVNFYQTGGPLHGNREIIAADPARTQILGDFRFDYKTEPPPCSAYPWFARHFLKGHTSIECDPQVWGKIENLIRQYISPTTTADSIQAAAF